jgi:hypothetical protein
LLKDFNWFSPGRSGEIFGAGVMESAPKNVERRKVMIRIVGNKKTPNIVGVIKFKVVGLRRVE